MTDDTELSADAIAYKAAADGLKAELDRANVRADNLKAALTRAQAEKADLERLIDRWDHDLRRAFGDYSAARIRTPEVFTKSPDGVVRLPVPIDDRFLDIRSTNDFVHFLLLTEPDEMNKRIGLRLIIGTPYGRRLAVSKILLDGYLSSHARNQTDVIASGIHTVFEHAMIQVKEGAANV